MYFFSALGKIVNIFVVLGKSTDTLTSSVTQGKLLKLVLFHPSPHQKAKDNDTCFAGF